MYTTISVLGCGWLGLPLTQHLKKNGYKLNSSVRSEESLKHLNSLEIECVRFDLDNFTVLDSDFFDCDLLIISTPNKNVAGHKNLLKGLKSSNIQRIIFTSSTSVYASSQKIIDESRETNDTILAKIEQLYLSSKIPATILRLGGLVGVNRHPGRFFKENATIARPTSKINLIHQSDIINAIQKLITKKDLPEILNLVSTEHPERFLFYKNAFQDFHGTECQFKPGKTLNEIEEKVISGNKIEKIIGRKIKLSDHYKFL